MNFALHFTYVKPNFENWKLWIWSNLTLFSLAMNIWSIESTQVQKNNYCQLIFLLISWSIWFLTWTQHDLIITKMVSKRNESSQSELQKVPNKKRNFERLFSIFLFFVFWAKLHNIVFWLFISKEFLVIFCVDWYVTWYDCTSKKNKFV